MIQRKIPQALPRDIEYLFDEVWELRSERNLVKLIEDLLETADQQDAAFQEQKAKEREAEEWQAVLDEFNDERHTPRK